MELLRSFLSHHFAGKLRGIDAKCRLFSQATLGMRERSIGFKTNGGWTEKEEQVKEIDYAKI